ncbi:MAG: flagellar M-ring protein FliF [Alphaproteobacteria bacterium]|nr:flagellar M-ring protein FliF [Alphaproteobacteria bacterium]
MARAPEARSTQVAAAVGGPSVGGSLLASGGGMLASAREMTAQPSFRRALPTIVTVIAAIAGIALYALVQQPKMTTLYASLPEAEKARVVDALTNSGYEVRVDPTTGDVLVPVANYHRSRMSLAAQGLPSVVPDGYAALGDIPMGTSRSVEIMRLKQAQEIELARSITEIAAVQSARVHLALPERSVFVREQETPTASVFVQIAPGRKLDEEQVDAIVNLIAASVPNMAREGVTVVDQQGRMLTRSNDDPSSILSDSQLRYRMRLESIYRSRIEMLVGPIVGAGNVNAQVNLDIDFTRREVTEERVDPEGNALRSTQATRDVTRNPEAAGIPGAVANRAPTEAELTGNLPGTEAGAADPSVESESTSSVQNYEISRKVETTMDPANRIMRVAVAVLVKEREAVNPETGLVEPVPFPAETLEEIRKLVAGVVGLDEGRGDVVTVTAQPFVQQLDESVKVEWFEMGWVKLAAQQFLTVLTLAVIALGVIRPLLNRVLVPSGGEAVARGGLSDDEVDALDSVVVKEGETLDEIKAKLKPKKSNISLEMLDTANTYDDKVAIIRMIVSDEAGRVSNVFKQMMKKDMSYL